MILNHVPVLWREVLGFLAVKPGGRYIDCTVGGGGHTEAILKKGGEVLGIDQDPMSLDVARKRLSSRFGESTGAGRACPGAFKLALGNFATLSKIASETGFRHVDGVLFDLGFASFQVDNSERGLSFAVDGPLDMRLDPTLGVTAADLLNALPETELYKLIKEVGDEKRARSVTRAIISRRALTLFTRTGELKRLIESVYERARRWKIHPATKTFMALRIAVNSELENIKQALPQALELVKPGGRIVVVSFHSGEDRIVKNVFRAWGQEQKAKILTYRPVSPKEMEISVNPRARSAKCRAIEKL